MNQGPSPFGRAARDALADEQYEELRATVVGRVRARLARSGLHQAGADLEGAYNDAWWKLLKSHDMDSDPFVNLAAWLAEVVHNNAVDELRGAGTRYRALPPVGDGDTEESRGGSLHEYGYEIDVPAALDAAAETHQWLISLRLRLSKRELLAIALRALGELSLKETSEQMGVSPKRLDKILAGANDKLGGLLGTIQRGEWCQEHTSLITAYALRVYPPDSERYRLAAAHVATCSACAAHVRVLRDITIIVPAPILMGGVIASGGGAAGILVGGSAASGGGAAAGGGLLSTLAGKAVVVCATAACAAGGAAVVIEQAAPDKSSSPRRAANQASAPVKGLLTPVATVRTTRATTTRAAATTSTNRTTRPAVHRRAVSTTSNAARQMLELGPEAPSATPSAPTERPQSKFGGTSELGPE